MALDFTVAKFPGVWTPSIAVLAVSFACATLSASFTDAASMACSPWVFLVLTSCTLAVFSVVVKLLSPLIAVISAWAILPNSALALDFSAPRSNAGLGAFGITTGSLMSDAVSLVVKVFPYASLGGIPPFAIFLTVIRSFSLSALVGVHVACPFVAFTTVCFCPLR